LTRSGVNFLVDFSILVFLCCMLLATFVVNFIFPPASEAAGWELWGMSYERWQSCQFLTVCVFSLGVLLHLILHWNWVCGFLTNRYTRWSGKPLSWNEAIKTAYGVTALIGVFVILGLMLLAAELQIRAPDEAGSGSVIPRVMADVQN